MGRCGQRQRPTCAKPLSWPAVLEECCCATSAHSASLDAYLPPAFRHGDQICLSRREVDRFLDIDLQML
ncbi:hypothetical protein LZ31DRAFT_608583 [Colletotrichum somersetense]|nr:hypothetical protein LZ31DRAFT_608583 [Colletotrichum somersetense]